MIERLLKGYLSVIALNSPSAAKVPFSDSVPLILADGASKWFEVQRKQRTGSVFVVGDGDSSNLDQLIEIKDQETTDFEKCIEFARKQDLLPSLVVGINEGEIDHVLGNILILLKYAENQSLFFLDQSPAGMKIGIPLEKGEWSIPLPQKTKVSIFPLVSCQITTSGLAWNLLNQTLIANGMISLRNHSETPEVTFSLSDGKALVVLDLSIEYKKF